MLPPSALAGIRITAGTMSSCASSKYCILIGPANPSPSFTERPRTKPSEYKKQVYTLPKHLDEKVASLHLAKIGVKLTKITPEQSKYLGVAEAGPFKPEHYRY